MQGQLPDFVVAHGVVLQREPAVGEHELGVVFLGSLDPPGRVNHQHVEFAHLLDEQVPVEVLHIAIDVGVMDTVPRLPQLPGSVKKCHRVQEFLAVLAVVGVDQGKLKLTHLL